MWLATQASVCGFLESDGLTTMKGAALPLDPYQALRMAVDTCLFRKRYYCIPVGKPCLSLHLPWIPVRLSGWQQILAFSGNTLPASLWGSYSSVCVYPASISGSQDGRRFLHFQETLMASLWRTPASLCICIYPLSSLLVSASSTGQPQNTSQLFAVSHFFIRVITDNCSINTVLSVLTVSCEKTD